MLRCNLAVLLAERGLKITAVSSDTKISRTTLTALANNYSQGIQFDTMNTLCNYLQITPDKLFLYSPINIEFTGADYNYPNNFAKLNFIVDTKRHFGEYCLSASLSLRITDDSLKDLDVFASLPQQEPSAHRPKDSDFISFLKALPTAFQNDIKSKVCDHLITEISKYIEVDKDISCSLYWPEEFYE